MKEKNNYLTEVNTQMIIKDKKDILEGNYEIILEGLSDDGKYVSNSMECNKQGFLSKLPYLLELQSFYKNLKMCPTYIDENLKLPYANHKVCNKITDILIYCDYGAGEVEVKLTEEYINNNIASIISGRVIQDVLDSKNSIKDEFELFINEYLGFYNSTISFEELSHMQEKDRHNVKCINNDSTKIDIINKLIKFYKEVLETKVVDLFQYQVSLGII